MSIDEAIEKFKFIENSDTPCPRYCILPCDKWVDESKQLAEWLEELKDYRDKNKMVVRIDCANSEEFKNITVKLAKEQYNKAIDDFAENISLEISESLIWGMIADCFKYKNLNDTSDKIVDYVINTANEIAEQLKGGREWILK